MKDRIDQARKLYEKLHQWDMRYDIYNFRKAIEANLPKSLEWDVVEISKIELEILKEKARKYDDLCK